MNKTFYELMDIPGISGHEDKVRKYMKDYMAKYPSFVLKQDKLGSLFGVKKSKNPKAKTVMIAGHMDEVGFIVAGITSNGLIKLQEIGRFLPEVVVSQVLNIYTESGKVIPGVVGSIPPHMQKSQKLEVALMKLDIGATSKAEVLSWGVQLGDMVLFNNQFAIAPNEKYFMGKAIDNRFGCGLALELIKATNDLEFDYNLVIGATVQEEVGLRGAASSTNMIKPDIFLAMDASPCGDVDSPDANSKLGDGFLLRIYDPGNIIHQGILKYIRKLAKDHEVKFQHFTSLGRTDAARAVDMLEGVIATTIGIPTRYIHSTTALANVDDIQAAKDILVAIVKDLTSDKIDQLQKGEL